jgi:hypothetical protein
MPNGWDHEAFEADLDATLEKGREAFKGRYAKELDALLGLSRTEIDAITPGTIDLEIYDALIEVVKEASRTNLAEAELKKHIEQLGKIAIEIAKHVAGLAALLD